MRRRRRGWRSSYPFFNRFSLYNNCLSLRHHRRLLPASLLIKVPLLPPMTICLSNSYFPKIFSSCSTLPATLTAADHLTEKGFGRTDSSSSATLTLFWHMSKLSPRGKPVLHIFSPTWCNIRGKGIFLVQRQQFMSLGWYWDPSDLYKIQHPSLFQCNSFTSH